MATDNRKPNHVRIIHIAVGGPALDQTVYGLGEDGMVYIWSERRGAWLFWKTRNVVVRT